jgi:hypothetical protein
MHSINIVTGGGAMVGGQNKEAIMALAERTGESGSNDGKIVSIPKRLHSKERRWDEYLQN